MNSDYYKEISEQQKQSWNNFSGGWKKWDEVIMNFLHPMGKAIIDYLEPVNCTSILDIAAGTGEPGLTMAEMMNDGTVAITDIAENMLIAVKEKAKARNITNFETHVCNASHMPFTAETFDAVSCRFGFMFFADMQSAANEMARVLKPGGRMAAAVWDIPEKNFWVTATMGTIMRMMELPPPPPEVPGMFRCCKPGRMQEIFETAGFISIEEHKISSLLQLDTAERYWEMMTEVGAPVAAALRQANEPMQQKIRREVTELIKSKYPGRVAIEGNALILTAKKK
jgi:ubiquinone/menaquinone biosynthesis C-methylase UbiE